MKKPIIWILWGMWPEASCYLYKQILSHYQTKYNAVQDNEYPHIIINNIGIDWFSEKWVEDEDLVKKQLLEWVHQLENAWVDTILMACNTVHIYYDFLQENSQGLIVNLIDEAAQKVSDSWVKNILILGSNTTNTQWLYDTYLEKYNIWFSKITRAEQWNIDNIIENVMQATVSEADKKYLEYIVWKYNREAVIIACTELPIAFEWLNVGQTFDTLSILTGLVESVDKK